MLIAIQLQFSAVLLLCFSFLEFLFLIPVVLYTRKKKIKFGQYLKVSLKKNENGKNQAFFTIMSILVAFAMIFVGFAIILVQNMIISLISESALEEATSNLNEITVVQPTIFDIFIYGIACFFTIAFNEEQFFRGLLDRKLPFSRRKNVLLSSIFFAVYHVVTTFDVYSILYMFLYYFTWGIVLSLIYRVCKDQLLFPMITHGLFDLLLFLLTYFM